MQEKYTSKVYLEPSQISNMELFKKIANSFKPCLIKSRIFAKFSTLDIWLSPENAYVYITAWKVSK